MLTTRSILQSIRTFMVMTGIAFLMISLLIKLVSGRGIGQDVVSFPGSVDAPGSVAGQVTGEIGQPLTGVIVSAYQYVYNSSPAWQAIRTASTDSDGNYRLSLMPAGLYRLEFRDMNDRYVTEYYSNSVSLEAANEIAVTGKAIAGINENLLVGGKITGTFQIIGDPPFAYADVYLETLQDGHWRFLRSVHLQQGQVQYEIGALPNNSYHVCIHVVLESVPYDLSECYDDVRSGTRNAQPISVTVGQIVSNVNFLLGDFGDLSSISGIVTSEAGQPLPGIDITASVTPYVVLGTQYSTKTDDSGAYTMSGMLPLSYTLYFFDRDGHYAFEYYDNAASVHEGKAFFLAPRTALSDVNVSLADGAQITGLITVQGETPTSVYANVYRKTVVGWENVTYVYWSNWGSIGNWYVLNGLPAGVYRLRVGALLGPNNSVNGFYGGADLDHATDIILGAGESKLTINVDLPGPQLLGEISGQVTTQSVQLSGIRVDVYSTLVDYQYLWDLFHPTLVLESGTWVYPLVHTYTNISGNYVIGGLPDGVYQIRFSDPNSRYASSFFNPSGSYTSSVTLSVKGSLPISNVNAELTQGGEIQGRILLATGQPVTNATVTAYYAPHDGASPFGYSTNTDTDGGYALQPLYPGKYYVFVFAGNQGEYFGAPSGFEEQKKYATLVSVSGNKTTSDINIYVGPNLTIYLPLVYASKR